MEFGNTMFFSLQILTAIILLFMCLLFNVALTAAGGGFVSVQRRPGERDIMIRLGGVSAMETSTGEGPGSAIDYIYREITDGSHLIQAVYDDEYQLHNCQITNDEEKITLLLTKQHELSMAQMRPNYIKRHSAQNTKTAAARMSTSNLPDFSPAIGIVPVFTKSDLKLESVSDKFQYDNATTGNLYFQYNGLVEDLPFPANTMLNMKTMKEECELYFQGVRDTYYQQHPEKSGGRYQRSTDTLSREKRGLLTWPGTLWCGKGTQAKFFSDLGENTFTDRCCREHDHCPLEWTILGRETKYHLFNRNFFTISHCKCDKMFHRCLRQAKTTVAKEVGTTFFNRFSIQCFVFKEKEQCVDESWWGHCNKYEKLPTAVIRDGHTFPKSAKRQAREAELSEERVIQAEQKAEERARKHTEAEERRARKRAETEERRNNKTMAAEARRIQKAESAQRKEAKQTAAEERRVMKEESALRKQIKQVEAAERRQNKTIAAEERRVWKEGKALRKEKKQAETQERRQNKTIAADERRVWKEENALRKEKKQTEAEERRQNKTMAADARVLKKTDTALKKEMKQFKAEKRRERKQLGAEERKEMELLDSEINDEAVETIEKESSERYIVTEMDTGEIESGDGNIATEEIPKEWLGQVEITRVNK